MTVSDHLISTYMIYLMIDNNNEKYVKFIILLDTIGAFCCCRLFMDIALTMDVEQELSNHAGDQSRKGTIRS